ncbi:MAG: HK97 family phage prohead protease [Burkholderiales bacterium]|nr:HK97 family phage prohead protease [Burkholderiales bacterium]
MVETAEQRGNQLGLEIRQTRRGRAIVGHAAVFFNEDDPGTQFEIAPEIFERVAPKAFDRFLATDQDIVALFNHDIDNVLGRRSAGTLRVHTDKIGLRYEVDLPASFLGEQIQESVNRGDLQGSSFTFLPFGENGATFDFREGIRTLNDVDVLDVGPVTFPAYDATTVDARALSLARTNWRKFEAKKRLAQVRLLGIIGK